MNIDDRVLILMPTNRDSDRTRRAVVGAGLVCVVCKDMDSLCEEIDRGAGTALMTEEAIETDREGHLQRTLGQQPAWSDFPLIVIARQEGRGHHIRESMNATLVERPLKVRSLLSVLRAALRSRHHQYEVRDYLSQRQQLEENRVRLASIVESSDDAIISKTLDGTILSWNAGAEQLFGYTQEEAIGQSVTMLIPPDRMDEERSILERLHRGVRVDHFETVRIANDGRRIDISLTISPIRNREGFVIAASKVARDITEKKLAEKDLHKQAERLSLLWETASVLLTTEDPDLMMHGLFARIAPHFGLEAYFNFMVDDDAGDTLQLESYHGITEETARSIQRLEFGRGICGAVAQTRQPITASHIQESDNPRDQLAKGFGLRAYACNPLIAGERLLGTLSFASRIRDTFDPEELEFLRTICHYVTVAYERLRFVRELREADRKKNDFIALLAHELRNPLAPIRNGLHVLRMSGGTTATASNALSMMDRQLTHMVRLIDDLLDVSRISRNKMELRRECVSLMEVVNTAIETSRPLIDAKGHELKVSLPPGSVYLNADLTRLSQVFGNLLSNSAKYTPSGGQISLSAQLSSGNVVVSVRDNGIGIPAESLGNIFDMFSQVDRSIEKSTGGLGIGLALVKGLVELHGGTVHAASEGQGSGSVFTVTLPVAATRGSQKSVGENGHAAGPKQRILVVDDNRDSAESLAMLLELLGNESHTANDGFEAVERAEHIRPEVILMDVGMPRLNGLEATRRIREQSWGRTMTIIALTGWGQEHDREQSRAAGCNGHLVKPVNLPDLQKLIRELLVSQAAG